ncbi:MAG TPA: hypothetical protein VEC93_16615, partial [Anaerolineae bacterium]|nr:hypothetical protein [Anaerolineae bacterium]
RETESIESSQSSNPPILQSSNPPTLQSSSHSAFQSSPAPDFTLTAANSNTVSLQDYRDKSNIVLVFYRGHT